jgi:competence protein ComEC
VKKSKWIVVFILIVIITIRFFMWPKDDETLRKLSIQKVTLSVQIIEEPDSVKDSQRFIAKTEDGNLIQVSTKYFFSPLKYGDNLKVEGRLQKITDSYGNYMRVRKVFYQMKNPKIEFINNSIPSRFKLALITIKNFCIQRINSLLPQPQSFLASGLILTGKGSLDADLQNEFKRVGLIHIVVLSGFNVSIVAVVVMALLGFLPPIVRFVIGMFFMTCFCLMVGGGASVMRSLFMNAIAIYGKTMQFKYDPLKGLFIAGLIMMVFNPMLLFFDPSFQMSFMATLGLIVLSEKISKRLSFLPEKFGIKETISATLGTQIAVTPLIMHFSGIVSLISLFTNIVVLPFIPFTMFFVVVAMLISFVSISIAQVFSFVSYVLLTYELWIVHVSASLPFAAIEFSTWSWKQTLICYFIMAIVYFCVTQTKTSPEKKDVSAVKPIF